LSVASPPRRAFRRHVLFSGHLLYFEHSLCSAYRNQSRKPV
jgi:hypothetical protein